MATRCVITSYGFMHNKNSFEIAMQIFFCMGLLVVISSFNSFTEVIGNSYKHY
jgi:hypothetical protein